MARIAKELRKTLMAAAAAGDLEETRNALEKLYNPGAHMVIFDESVQWKPRVFAPCVDAAIIAAVKGAPSLRDELIENIDCLHQQFGIDRHTADSIKTAVSLVDVDDSADVVRALVEEQLRGTDLVQHLRIGKYL